MTDWDDDFLPPSNTPGVGYDLITPGNLASILSAFRNCGVSNEKQAAWILSELTGKKLEKVEHLPQETWFKMRNVWYPRWPWGVWTLNASIRNVIKELSRQYEERVLGQMSLFDEGD